MPIAMNAAGTHAALVEVAGAWLRRRGCHGVLLERGHRSGPDIPDAIGWDTISIVDVEEADAVPVITFSVVVEVKVSRDDFRADAAKPHRSNTDGLGRERWYLTPKGLVAVDELPVDWGLLEYDGRCCRKIGTPRRLESTPASLERERNLLLREIRAYHAQNLHYKKGADRWVVKT